MASSRDQSQVLLLFFLMFKLNQLLWQRKSLIKDNMNIEFLVNMKSQFLLLSGSKMIIFFS